MAALGRPVVPPVYCSQAMSSSSASPRLSGSGKTLRHNASRSSPTSAGPSVSRCLTLAARATICAPISANLGWTMRMSISASSHSCDMVVDGSQGMQPGVHRAGQADRGLDHPDVGGIDAERADAAALRAAPVFQHPADPTRSIGRLGVGNGAVILDERRAIAVTGQCFNDQRGVGDSAVWLSHDFLSDVEVAARHWVAGHRRRSTVSSR